MGNNVHKCPQCGSRMVREHGGVVYLSYPEQWDERDYCGCGYRGAWERVHGKTPQQALQEDWEKINCKRTEQLRKMSLTNNSLNLWL